MVSLTRGGGRVSVDNNNVTYIPVIIMSCRDHKVEKTRHRHDQPVFSAGNSYSNASMWPIGHLNAA